MSRQSAFFAPTAIARQVELAAPVAISRRATRNQENSEFLGGMRRPDRAVSAPAYQDVGRRMRQALLIGAAGDQRMVDILDRLRQGGEVDGLPPDLLATARINIASVIGSWTPAPSGPDSEFIRAWGVACGDPDASEILPRWLRDGASLGILRTVDLCGIFPPIESDDQRDPRSLWSDSHG